MICTVQQAAKLLQQSGVIAYPTEAVFGLGCNPADEPAVLQLLALKSRPVSKGLILVAAGLNQLTDFIAPLSDADLQRVNQTWPGPVTWVVPANSNAPQLITGGRETVAVRVSAHPIVAALCRASGHALVSSSANKSGQPPAMTVDEVEQQFGQQLSGIVEGDVGGLDNPSRIIDLKTNTILRA